MYYLGRGHSLGGQGTAPGSLSGSCSLLVGAGTGLAGSGLVGAGVLVGTGGASGAAGLFIGIERSRKEPLSL